MGGALVVNFWAACSVAVRRKKRKRKRKRGGGGGGCLLVTDSMCVHRKIGSYSPGVEIISGGYV